MLPAAGVDANGDQVPDVWEVEKFGSTNSGYLADYTAGTDPTNLDSSFRLDFRSTNGDFALSFDALRASGDGYYQKVRYYDLEQATDLCNMSWAPVAGMTNILGDDFTELFLTRYTNAPPGPHYYRVKVRLLDQP